MPITTSAKKALRVSKRRRAFNLRRTKVLKEAAKTFQKSLTVADLAKAYQAIDKAAKRGVIKKNTAARKKSRLAGLLKK